MKVRLTRKLAERLDGVDVSAYRAGDVMDLPQPQAELLVAERWALPVTGAAARHVRRHSSLPQSAVAADRTSSRRTIEQLRRVGEQIERGGCETRELRRAEDRIREALHDARARTVEERRPPARPKKTD